MLVVGESLCSELGRLQCVLFPLFAPVRGSGCPSAPVPSVPFSASQVVERVRKALKSRLDEVDWMSAETRERAILKMAKFNVKIGFPDKWIDYSNLEVIKGDHFGNELRAATFHHNRMIKYTNAATDR